MRPRGWAAITLVTTLATTAHAQVASESTEEVGIERFRPGFDRASLLDVEWASAPGHLQWSASALVGFAHDPLEVYTLDGRSAGAVVSRRITTNLVGLLGLGSRLAIGAGLDVVANQASDVQLMSALPGGGLGDARLLAKGVIVESDTLHVALLGTLVIPGGAGDGYLRESGIGISPAVAVSTTRGGMRGALNAGIHFKPRVETLGLVSDDELFARAGLAVDVAGVAEGWLTTSFATPIADREANRVAFEVFAGAARSLSPMMSVFGAGGIGLENGFGTPDWRALIGVRFGSAPPAVVVPPIVPVEEPVLPPAPVDTDGDGIVDGADRCPRDAETANQFRDDDGCPEQPATLAGRVVDPDGRPLARASISIQEVESKNGPQELTADDDGRFSATVLGGATVVVASLPEYEATTVQLEIEPGQSSSPTITLVRKVRQGQLRGQVLSFDGKPLQATVTVTSKAGPPASVTADAEGNFSVDLPEGAFQVEITADGYRAQKRSVKIKLDGVTVLNVDMRGTK